MFNLKQFITDHVICHPTSMFVTDIEANKEALQTEIGNKSVCVIGGAGLLVLPLLEPYCLQASQVNCD